MKKSKKILMTLFLVTAVISILCIPAFAVTESEVEAQVAASSKESVTGNVLIWFLCAVAFLKVSQKIDSFMATLGVNVGRTGGSLLAEAMIAMRSVTMVIGGGRGGGANRAGSVSGTASGKSGNSGMAGFFKGGLIGMTGRHITNSAVQKATTQTSAVRSAQGQVHRAATAAAQTASGAHISSEVNAGETSVHMENSALGGTAPQEGIIVTGGGVSASAVPIEGASPVSPVPDGIPPQEGTVLTGGEMPLSISQADSMPQSVDAPPASIPTDMTPPQEGVVLTGSEPPPVSQADPMPQAADATPESVSGDTISSQESIILTGGDTTIHAPQSGNIPQAHPAAPVPQESSDGGRRVETHTEQTSQTTHSTVSNERVQTSRFHMFGGSRPTLGGMVFSHSLQSGGSFANDVIGTVARGEVAGSITGDMAAQSLASYMGYAVPSIGSREIPAYSDVEIGRGRITGVETAAGASVGQPFAMYHVDQYTAPSGDYTKVVSADGTQWFKQYAQDAVERKPYMAPDDTVAYHERIIKKLPDAPKRKDRI